MYSNSNTVPSPFSLDDIMISEWIDLRVADGQNALVDWLREQQVWLTWAMQIGRDGEPGKIPGKIERGRLQKFSATDLNELGMYDSVVLKTTAVAALGIDGRGGIGASVRHLPDVELVDIDHCILDGIFTNSLVQAFVDASDTYAELSPSGTGLRLAFDVIDGKPTGFKRHIPDASRKDVQIQTNCTFFTITGNVFRDLPVRTITQKELLELYALVGTTKEASMPLMTPAQHDEPYVSSFPDDKELLEKAFASKNGDKMKALYGGDISAYNNDDSVADLSLCGSLAFWTGKDAERMDRIFRASKLVRPKWDEKRDDTTYGEMTIAKAIEGCLDVYTGTSTTTFAQSEIESNTRPLTFISDTDLLAMKLPPMEFQVESLFAKGTLNMLSAPSNQYKTWLMLRAAMSVAHGLLLFDKFKTMRTNVLIVEEEDPLILVQERYKKLLQEGEQPGGIFFAVDTCRMIDDEWADEIIQNAEARNVSFVMLDSLRALHLENENESHQMQPIINALRRITRKGITILMLHHHKKGQPGNGSEQSEGDIDQARGSSGIVAAVHGHITCKEKKIAGWTHVVIHQPKLKAAKKLDPFLLRLDERMEPERLAFTYVGPYDKDIVATDAMEGRLIAHLREHPSEYFTRKRFVDLDFATSDGDQTMRAALARLVEKGQITSQKYSALSDAERFDVAGKTPSGSAAVYRLTSEISDDVVKDDF